MPKYSYLKYIWHDPNCTAWHRDPKTNKPYPHLVKKFGGRYKCTCGYDKDLDRLMLFKKEKGDRMKKNKIPREYVEYLEDLVNDFFRIGRPISKVIMVAWLSGKFNLSPEYCREIVYSLYP